MRIRAIQAMKILDRYVGKQLLVTALFAVTVLSVVLVLGNVFKQIFDLLINHDVPLRFILGFVACVLPFSLTFTIPWGFLTAVLLVFGKLSAENELVALRTSGIGILRICVSLFVLAFVCVGICLWINLDIAPRAQEEMKNAIFNIATSNPISMFGSDQVIDEFPGKKIYVGKKVGNELHNILVFGLNDRNEPLEVIHAKKGLLQTDQANQQVLMYVWDGRYERRNPDNPGDLARIQQGITVRETVFPIPLQQLYERNRNRRGITQMTINELLKNQNAEDTVQKRTAARFEVQKRFSFSFASLAFALIGVPLAITAHRRETSIGFLLSMVIAFTYFFFMILAQAMQENPKAYPDLLVWLPNVLFISLGGVMFWRLWRR